MPRLAVILRHMRSLPAAMKLMLGVLALVVASSGMVVAKPVKPGKPCGAVAMVKLSLGGPAVLEVADDPAEKKAGLLLKCFEGGPLSLPAVLSLKLAPRAVTVEACAAPVLRSALLAIDLPPPRTLS